MLESRLLGVDVDARPSKLATERRQSSMLLSIDFLPLRQSTALAEASLLCYGIEELQESLLLRLLLLLDYKEPLAPFLSHRNAEEEDTQADSQVVPDVKLSPERSKDHLAGQNIKQTLEKKKEKR